MTCWSRLSWPHQSRQYVFICLWIISLGMVPKCCLGRGTGDKYFYHDMPESNVQEYVADQGQNRDFLYSENYPNARIVEFYAHWCPHCRHFKPKYIELSNKLAVASVNMRTKVETFAVSCVPNRDICRDLHIHAYPTVMFYPSHSINGTKVLASELHPMDILRMVSNPSIHQLEPKSQTVVDPLRQEQQQQAIPNQRDMHQMLRDQKTKETENAPQHHFMHRTNVQSFQDAHLSFDFAMKTAVYTSVGPLPEQPKKVLLKFLRILQRTLPVSSTMQPVVNDLIQNFDSITQSDAKLNALLEKHPPPAVTWSPASLQHGTGYTAGLWQLFHIMSVGLVEWNHMAISDQQKLAPLEVADCLRNYIEFFFQCEVCRLNFLTEYDACSFDRCNRLTSQRKGTLQEYAQYPLWLFETHNAVNVRLRKERIELRDEAEGVTTEVQVMWPPTDDCPSCWLSEGRWDERSVFEYLMMAYWPESEHSGVLRTLQSNRTKTVDQKSEGFRKDDFDDGGFKFPFSSLALFTTSLMFVVWQRKRQFDQKGVHKKKDIA